LFKFKNRSNRQGHAMSQKRITPFLMGMIVIALPLQAMKRGSTVRGVDGRFIKHGQLEGVPNSKVVQRRCKPNKPLGPINVLLKDSLEPLLIQMALTQAKEDVHYVGGLACASRGWETIINSPKVTHYLERAGCWNLATRGAKISRDINSAIISMSKLEKNIERISVYLQNPFADLGYHAVSEDEDPETYTFKGHNTALTQACYSGSSRLVELYLKEGADANMRCSDEITPLYWSVAGIPVSQRSVEHRLASVEMLCNGGADVNQANKSNRAATILHTMATLAKTYPKSAYTYIEFLLEKGADINQRDTLLRTPLHAFFSTGLDETPHHGADHLEIVSLFLDKKTDCSLKDIRGATVLDYAEKHGKKSHYATLLRVHALTAHDDTDFPFDSL
jgi:hypothetical protein